MINMRGNVNVANNLVDNVWVLPNTASLTTLRVFRQVVLHFHIYYKIEACLFCNKMRRSCHEKPVGHCPHFIDYSTPIMIHEYTTKDRYCTIVKSQISTKLQNLIINYVYVYVTTKRFSRKKNLINYRKKLDKILDSQHLFFPFVCYTWGVQQKLNHHLMTACT